MCSNLRKLICICSLAHHDAKIRIRNPAYPMMLHEDTRCHTKSTKQSLMLAEGDRTHDKVREQHKVSF